MWDLTPLPGDPWPWQPSRLARQVHAVLAWLVVEADMPDDVHLPLVDALLAWAPLMGQYLFPAEPGAGVDADLHQVLEGMWWRLGAQAVAVSCVDKVVLAEVRGRLGLVLQAPRPRPVSAPGVPGPRSPGR